jgi:hypothetical protein
MVERRQLRSQDATWIVQAGAVELLPDFVEPVLRHGRSSIETRGAL